ncbi:tetratricopeptide repeat protein 37 isoform X2 [Aplysia californica]|uniref:Tetratricopeptide repeat protein 37 isoform X2 n=1 Tax=Aplysia californica TaxID=6500 RepID=A0ABM1AAE1_APLCA|nr:tetratricopeptide repeat protein 37 isoform X2 [Aplysia californica]
MDAKEIKACLKAARESIRTKDFKEALKQCKAILAVDKNNYNALVFVGVAAEGMDQPDQALKAYKRATEEAPEQLLAWQGLSSMLDKKEDLLSAEEAADLYSKLIELNASDSSKQTPYMSKLADLYVRTSQEDKAVDLISKLLTLESDEEKKRKWNKTLITQLSPQAPKLPDERLTLYEKALKDVLDDSSVLTPEEVDNFTQLLLVITSQKKTEVLRESCNSLRQRFPNASPPLELLLQCYIDESIGDSSPPAETVEKIKDLTAELLTLKPSSVIAKVGSAFQAIRLRNGMQARDFLQDANDECISGLYYLSRAHLCLHSYEKCLRVCEKGIAACNSARRVLCAPTSSVVRQFQLVQAAAHREIGTADAFEKALAILDEVQEQFPAQASLTRAYIKLDQGELEDAEECAKNLPADQNSSKILRALIQVEKGQQTEALKQLQDAVASDPEDAVATLQLGKLLWELRDSKEMNLNIQQCFTTLLKAAKLDPYNYESFLYIGHFYKLVQGDAVKARRCYQKAYDLSGGKDEPGSALVDTLMELGEESQSIKILENVTAKAAAGCAKWAWLRLGLHQTRQEDPTTAIASLQSALRADPNDNHVWECLADAYFQRGSFTAALKAFTKASELDPESLYCQYQIASIKQTLGSLSEAVQEYKQVLGMSAHYVPVLKGLGESLIQLAKHNVGRCLDGLAQDYAEEALLYLTRAAAHRPDLSCLWKLMGEACTLTHCLASDAFRIPAKLVGKSASDSGLQTVNKQQLLEIGARCYSQAVKILPDQSALWHDLGISLYRQSQVLVASGEVTLSLAVLQRAKQAVRKALSLEPKDWRHWNILGVLACCKEDENLGLAQHCFIKSIGCESSNVVAWSNLGALYLSQSEIKLAHDAFKSAQSVDPTYVACWVGQALIAEVVGHEEAMDLFRHTTELGVHLESALGYGQWVVTTLGDQEKRSSELFHYCIQQMAAVPAACDALIRYTSRIKTDSVAYNMLGLLLEHQKFFQSATEAYEKALVLLQDGADQSRVNDVRLNLARNLCSHGKYDESVSLYGQCDLSAQMEHTCLYGLALYHSDKLVEAFNVLEKALEQARSDQERSNVHAALGMAAYKFKDMDGAKSQLFSSFQTSQPSVQGLLALCALGLLQGDLTLASAVLEELSKLGDKDKYLRQIALLCLFRFMAQNDKAGGETYMRELVETYPEEASLWSLLSSYILLVSPDQGPAASECCVTALSLGSDADCLNDVLLQCRAQMLAGHHSRQDRSKNALRSAQRAFHLNPGSVSAQSTFVSAVHAEAVLRLALHGNSDLLQVEQDLLSLLLNKDLSPELKTWFLQHSVVNRILAGDVQMATAQAKLLSEFPDPTSFNKLVQNSLTSTVDSGLDHVSEANSLPLVLAISLLIDQGKFTEAVALLKQFVKGKEEKISAAFYKSLLERSAFISYKGLQESDSEVLKENLDTVAQTFKQKEISSTIVNALQAMRTEDNKRLAKHLFATALDQVDAGTDVGYVSSLSRQGLVSLLWDSAKDSDQQLVKALLEDGKASKDSGLDRLVKELKANK